MTPQPPEGASVKWANVEQRRGNRAAGLVKMTKRKERKIKDGGFHSFMLNVSLFLKESKKYIFFSFDDYRDHI